MLSHTPSDGFLGLALAACFNLHIISADVNKSLYLQVKVICAGDLITIAVFTNPTLIVVINHMSPGLVSTVLLN